MIARGRTWKTSFEPTLERRKVNRMEWRAEKSKNVQRWRSRGEDEAVFHSYAPFRRKSSPEDMHDTFETFFDTRRCLARLEKATSLFWLGISRNSWMWFRGGKFLFLWWFGLNCHFSFFFFFFDWRQSRIFIINLEWFVSFIWRMEMKFFWKFLPLFSNDLWRISKKKHYIWTFCEEIFFFFKGLG